MANENKNGADGQLLGDRALQPERQATGGLPERGWCRRCGGGVVGRRRNGYCSDRCRMQDRRSAGQRRRLELLDTISDALKELRRELLS